MGEFLVLLRYNVGGTEVEAHRTVGAASEEEAEKKARKWLWGLWGEETVRDENPDTVFSPTREESVRLVSVESMTPEEIVKELRLL